MAPDQEDWRPPEAKLRSILHLGSFFGELMRRELGGSWQAHATYPQNPLQSRLALAGGAQIFPFSRVYKRLKNGASEPLEPLYRQARQMTGVTGQASELDGWVRYARHFEGLGREDLAAAFYERALALPLAPAARATVEARRAAAVRAAAAREAAAPAEDAPATPQPPPPAAPAPGKTAAAPQRSQTAGALAEARQTHTSRAAALAAQGRHAEALAELDLLLELSPSSPEGLLGRAAALVALRKGARGARRARGDRGTQRLRAAAVVPLGDRGRSARRGRGGGARLPLDPGLPGALAGRAGALRGAGGGAGAAPGCDPRGDRRPVRRHGDDGRLRAAERRAPGAGRPAARARRGPRDGAVARTRRSPPSTGPRRSSRASPGATTTRP